MEWTNLRQFFADTLSENLIAAMLIQWGIVGLFYLFCYIDKVKPSTMWSRYIDKVKPSTMWSRYIVLGVALVITFLFAGICFGYASIDIYHFVRSWIF